MCLIRLKIVLKVIKVGKSAEIAQNHQKMAKKCLKVQKSKFGTWVKM